VPQVRGSLDVHALTAMCPKVNGCPMFTRLYAPAFRQFQVYYCRVEFFEKCARLRLERAGEPVPPDLMPDGRDLGPRVP